jgi:hypothetical protein
MINLHWRVDPLPAVFVKLATGFLASSDQDTEVVLEGDAGSTEDLSVGAAR